MVSAYKAVSAGNWEQVTKLVHVITKFRLFYHRLGKMLVYIPNVSYRYSYYYTNKSELFCRRKEISWIVFRKYIRRNIVSNFALNGLCTY